MITNFIMVTASALTLTTQSTTPSPPQPTAPPTGERRKPTPRNDIVVIGNQSNVVVSTDRLSFNVSNDLNVQNGTVADALRAVPSVDVDLEGRVSLRGDVGVTIMIDGRPSAMLRGETRGDTLLSMPAGQIERVEIISNPSAAMSPEGSGGVINLVTKQARVGSRYGTLRAAVGTPGRGSASANGVLSGKKLTLTGDVWYRRSRGGADTTLERKRAHPATGAIARTFQVIDDETSMQVHNARLGAEYSISPRSRLTGNLTYLAGNLANQPVVQSVSDLPAASFGRTSDASIRRRNLVAQTSWRRTLPGSGHVLTVDLQMDRTRQRRRIYGVTEFAAAPTSFEQIGDVIESTDVEGNVDYKRPLGEGGSINLGYEGDLAESDFSFRGVRGDSQSALLPIPSLTNRFAYNQAVHAVYSSFQIDKGKWEAQVGLRVEQAVLDIHQQTDAVRVKRDYSRLYPTGHLGYELSDTEKLRASYSRRIQRPSAQDLNPYTIYLDPLNLRRGNPFLRPEVIDSFETSWQRRKGGTFYSLTAFYRTSYDGVTDVVQDIGDNVFLNTRANLATGERAGIEVVASGRLSKKLVFNASGGFLWNQIDPRHAGVSQRRSGETGTARASLTWQPSVNDLVQVSGNYSGPQLVAQGYRRSGSLANVGYRRKVDERFSLSFTGQNILDTARQDIVIDTPILRDRVRRRGPGPALYLGLTWNLGSHKGRKQSEPAFDFDQGAAAPAG